MNKLKNTAASLTAAVMSAVISVAANAEGGLAASKAVTGTKALLNDISNILLVVAPLVGTACMAVRKDPYTRISVVTQIGNMIKFRRTQQNFRYVYKSPWEQS